MTTEIFCTSSGGAGNLANNTARDPTEIIGTLRLHTQLPSVSRTTKYFFSPRRLSNSLLRRHRYLLYGCRGLEIVAKSSALSELFTIKNFRDSVPSLLRFSSCTTARTPGISPTALPIAGAAGGAVVAGPEVAGAGAMGLLVTAALACVPSWDLGLSLLFLLQPGTFDFTRRFAFAW